MENGFQTTFRAPWKIFRSSFSYPSNFQSWDDNSHRHPPPRAREFLDQGKMDLSLEVTKHVLEGFGGFFPYLEDTCNLFLYFYIGLFMAFCIWPKTKHEHPL